jgi:hypothetical protein
VVNKIFSVVALYFRPWDIEPEGNFEIFFYILVHWIILISICITYQFPVVSNSEKKISVNINTLGGSVEDVNCGMEGHRSLEQPFIPLIEYQSPKSLKYFPFWWKKPLELYYHKLDEVITVLLPQR